MRLWNVGLVCAMSGMLSLGFPGRVLAQDQQPVTASSEQARSTELPDSPGAVQFGVQSATQQQSNANQPSASTPQPQNSQPTAGQAAKPQEPVGTAAAEAPVVSGVGAAQPAGVAVAPAKQHRVRIIVLKVGAIVGAGVALGATMALTAATPSRPPGAH